MLLQFLKSAFGRRTSPAIDETGYDRVLKSLVDAGKFSESLALYDEIVSAGIRPCEPQFDAAYRRSLEATTTAPYALRRRSRFHQLYRLLEEVLPLDGDIAECGCYRGLSSHLMLSRLRRADPGYDGAGYHVLDSFEGLSEPGPEDRLVGVEPPAQRVHLAAQRGWFAVPLEVVRQGLAEFPGVSYHPGWIPASLSGLPERRYRFVHLDLDLHDPTLGALEYFFPRLVPGAILVCDDFNWPGERKAIEDFCARQGIAFETTPHNQAVLRRSR
jgi:pentatricopeptide repeat protein